jgi:hypothetical protein
MLCGMKANDMKAKKKKRDEIKMERFVGASNAIHKVSKVGTGKRQSAKLRIPSSLART